jgi:hypothetical protein
MHTKFWSETPERKRPCRRLGIDGEIILECILGKIGWEVMDWIHLAQGRDQWESLVNMVMNY